MDERYVSLEWRPELDRPVLVAAFSGWNDAAEAASYALGTLDEAWGAKKFGAFEAEEFYDYQVTRPQIKLTEGVTRAIEWPENTLSAGSGGVFSEPERGAVLLSGPEPNFRWRAFSRSVVEVAQELGVELVVTMGALLADVPHSRPASVSANSQDPTLTESLSLSPSRYEGPTGITGVLHRACSDAGLPSVSFWAAVPHYLPSVPSAPAALALLENFSKLLGANVDTSDLERAAESYEEQVSQAVAQDPNLRAYVEMLEERHDETGDERELPTGEDLAQELEDFLRGQE